MNTATQLPRGIRNNNPGNLRAMVGPQNVGKVVDGFAQFFTSLDGITSYFHLVHAYYFGHGIKTLPQFIERYAPSNENDTRAYIRAVGIAMNLNPLGWATTDLELGKPWRAIQLANAMFLQENGAPAPSWAGSPYWYTPREMIDGLQHTARWQFV